MAGIFKAYDIRGVYPTELNEEMMEKIGAAFGTLKGKNIIIGSDVRKSGPFLKEAFIKGLLSTGVKLADARNISTPMMIFATAHYGFDAGATITASHNPPQYNGVKFFDRGGIPISYEAGIKDIEELVVSGDFTNGEGSIFEKDIYHDYKAFLLSNLKITSAPWKIVVDCFNGADSKIAPQVLKALGADVIELRCGFNGDFPEAGPDPSHPGNLDMLRKKVLEEKADIGFAYDGDGDRLAVVDPKGNIIDTKIVFSLLAEGVPKGSKIVYDILTSDMVADSINKNQSIPIVCRVGHTYITEKILKEKAVLGGELSGHFYFKETFGGDDALFASLKVLEYLVSKEISISEYAAARPLYFSGAKRVMIKESEKLPFIENLKKELSKSYKIDTLDGVKVLFDNGWAVFRSSNTEPKISIAYESQSEEEFEKIKKFVEEIVSRIAG